MNKRCLDSSFILHPSSFILEERGPAMSISVWCACGQQLTVLDEHAGQHIRCRLCGRTLTVPEAPSARVHQQAPRGDEDYGGEAAPSAGGSALALAIACLLVLMLVGVGVAILVYTQGEDKPPG